jgi:hypothetical protein
LDQGSHSADARAAEQLLLVLMPPLRILIPKMRLFGFLPFLVPFIFLGGVQEPGLVDGFFFSKYGEHSPFRGVRELDGE